MRTKLRIGIRVFGLGTLDIAKPGNVQGDEMVARSWQKYLLRRDDIAEVLLYGPKDVIDESLHVAIDFNPFLESNHNVKSVLYMQNAFPQDTHAGGTVGVFESQRDRFDGYLFTSGCLMSACSAEGAVIPFATDEEVFYPQWAETFRHPVSFVGNDIRGPIVNHRYLMGALPFGLVIYGNMWHPPLSAASRGKLSMEQLPKVYTSSLINLNCHIGEHVIHDTINLRIYDILACEGFVLSDRVPSLSDVFGDAVVCTEGYEDTWAKLVHYSADTECRKLSARTGRKIVLGNHTFVHRMENVVAYLKELL